MERVGFILKVREGRLSDYRKAHLNVWPEMREALRQAGWHNYSLFLREDGLLFGYVETPSFDDALGKMAETEVNGRWQELMAPYFENIGGGHPDQAMVRLEEVFHLE